MITFAKKSTCNSDDLRSSGPWSRVQESRSQNSEQRHTADGITGFLLCYDPRRFRIDRRYLVVRSLGMTLPLGRLNSLTLQRGYNEWGEEQEA